MKHCRVLLLVLLAIFATLPPVFAAGLIIVEDSSWWPGPIPPSPPPPPWPPRPRPVPRPHVFAPLEINSVKVDARIDDQVAITSVDEEFYNPNSARLEGTFVFPIPKGAHLDKFTMEIDGKQVQAELLAADKARHIYEDIVRKLRDPALLEYGDRDIFKVRIFPIEPNSKKRITLSYTQLLKADNGLVGYNLPLSMEKLAPKPIKSLSLKVALETRRPLKSIYSPTHSLEIKRDGTRHATAGYEGSEVLPDTDLSLYFAPEKDELGVNLLAHKAPGEDGYFLLLASPGIDVQEKQVLPKDVAFVLDTSGSMVGKKLEQAKKALDFCIENLNRQDRFELLRFSTEVEPLFNQLVEASSQNRARAQDFVKDLKAIGGTAIEDALKRAFQLVPRTSGSDPARPFLIIFLTDGMPTIGTTDESQILQNVKSENNGRTRVFCFGIGTDVNTHLLDTITEQTRAFSQYVLPEEDLEVKVSNFFSKIKDPILTNPTLTFSGDVHATKLYPSPLPDLFKGEQLVLVGRYSGHGPSAAVIEGAINGATRKFAYDLKFPEESKDNEFIPRLWATRRVGYLLDEIRLHGGNAELRDEVTDLARKYAIVTPYTAYLIMEDEKQHNLPMTMRSLQSFERDQAAREEVRQSWKDFSMNNAGDAGVASAQSSLMLRSAEAPAVAKLSADNAFYRRYGLRPGGSIAPSANAQSATVAPPPPAAAERAAQYTQQSQYVAGKTFFQNDRQWIDSAIQKASDAKRVRLQFGSKEYFDFTAQHPQAMPWLALGQNVQFLLEQTIYEIYE